MEGGQQPPAKSTSGEIPASGGGGANSHIPLRPPGPGMSTPPPAAAAARGTNNDAGKNDGKDQVNDEENNDERAGGDHSQGAAGAGGRRDKDATIPIANLTRVMRQALPAHAKITDSAKAAMQDCLSKYISFVTSEANRRCRQDKRRTLTAEDLLWSLGNLGFGDYVEPLKLYLQKYREAAEAGGDPHSSAPVVVSVPHGGGTAAPSGPGFHEQALPTAQPQPQQYPPRPWQQPRPPPSQQYPPRPRQQRPRPRLPPPSTLPEFILGLPAQCQNPRPGHVSYRQQSPPVFPTGDGSSSNFVCPGGGVGNVSSLFHVGEGNSSTLSARGDGSSSSRRFHVAEGSSSSTLFPRGNGSSSSLLHVVGEGSSSISTPIPSWDGSSCPSGGRRGMIMTPAVPLRYSEPGGPIYPFNQEAPFQEVGGPVRPPAPWYGFAAGVIKDDTAPGPSSSSDTDQDPNQEASYSFFDVIFAPYK